MKPPFCPYQTHSHPNLLGSIVQQFSLGIKEQDDTDKKSKISSVDLHTADMGCAPHIKETEQNWFNVSLKHWNKTVNQIPPTVHLRLPATLPGVQA